MYQKTIKNTISCLGVGVHSGKSCSLTLHPAPENHGIKFYRSDVGGNDAYVLASYDLVTSTMLGTTITNKSGVDVATIEHLMAAIWGADIDNLLIEIDSPEIPIMDGSSNGFLFMVQCAGHKIQKAPRKYLQVNNQITVQDSESFISLSPAENFTVDLEIDFPGSIIGRQAFNFSGSKSEFCNDIANARTFGFKEDADRLKKAGLAMGASLDNVIVIEGQKVINQGGLRYHDEFVRHKLLDLIGDFYLAGMALKANVKTFKPGHKINNLLLRELFKNQSNWQIVEAAA